MALDERALQEQLTPEQRRSMLRAFADRMLLKLAELEDPKVLADVERDVRVAAAIERIYARCDRAEKLAPCPHKIEADRADNAAEAIRARNRFAQTFDWGEERRKALGRKWTKAQKHLKSQLKAPSLASGRGGGRSRDRRTAVGGSLTSHHPITQPEHLAPGASRNPTTVCAPDGAGRPGTGRPASPTSWGGIEPHTALGAACTDDTEIIETARARPGQEREAGEWTQTSRSEKPSHPPSRGPPAP